MRIEVESPMERAFLDGDDTYTPVFEGHDMDVECGNLAISLNNLSKIVTPDRQVMQFLLGRGQVLVVFEGGASYLATGFGYGPMGTGVLEFASFAAKHGFGDYDQLCKAISARQPDFYGPFEPLPQGDSDEITIPKLA